MWVILIFIIPIMSIKFVLSVYKSKIKGFAGEKVVAVCLCGLDEEKYILLNDITLKTARGTTQIDHILVSIYGVFVIETKNYKGQIIGNDYNDNWTKNMYGTKYTFYNPIKQNYGHIMALKELLNLPENTFIPIVTFSPDAELKVSTKNIVINMPQLRKTVLSYNRPIFSNQRIKVIAGNILKARIMDKDIKNDHVAAIRTKTNDINDKINNNICPKCGGRLIIRKSKYGDFRGCSNFPKCRYTVKM